MIDLNPYIERATAEVGNYYTPAIEQGRAGIRRIRQGTRRRVQATRKQIPLLRKRYQSLLKDLIRSETRGKEEIARGEENQVGGIKASEASRGNWGGSVENSEILNTKESFGRLLGDLINNSNSQRRTAKGDLNENENTVRSQIADLIADKIERVGQAKSAIQSLFTRRGEAITSRANEMFSFDEDRRQWNDERQRWEEDTRQKGLDRAQELSIFQQRLDADAARYGNEQDEKRDEESRARRSAWTSDIEGLFGKKGWKGVHDATQKSASMMREDGVDPQGVLDRLMLNRPPRAGRDYHESSTLSPYKFKPGAFQGSMSWLNSLFGTE